MARLDKRKEPVNFNVGEIISPFQLKGQRWDQPLGQWRQKAALWRKVFWLQAITIALLTLWALTLLAGPRHQVLMAEISSQGFLIQPGYLGRSANVMNVMLRDYIKRFMLSKTFAISNSDVAAKTILPYWQWLNSAKIVNIKLIGSDEYQVVLQQPGVQKELIMLIASRVKLSSSQKLNNPLGFRLLQFDWPNSKQKAGVRHDKKGK